MQIWLDTIDSSVIADAVQTGILAGVTTNPSILSNTANVRETLTELLNLQPGPVAVQVTSHDPASMIEEGVRIFAFSSRMVVKVPINRNGLIAIKQLHHKGIPVMGTGILFPSQALLASNLGTSYIAPYFGHMGDEAAATLKTMVEIMRMNGSSTKILVASLKHLDHIILCASLGVAAITIKPELYGQLVADQPVVESFYQRFISDWAKTHGHLSIKEALASPNRV